MYVGREERRKRRKRDKTRWWVDKSINGDRDKEFELLWPSSSSCHSRLVWKKKKKERRRMTTSNALQQVLIKQTMIIKNTYFEKFLFCKYNATKKQTISLRWTLMIEEKKDKKRRKERKKCRNKENYFFIRYSIILILPLFDLIKE